MLWSTLLACQTSTPPDPERPQREPTVVPAGAHPEFEAASGKAQVRKLAAGDNAFLAELWLDPNAKVPLHRDETEEYLVVQQGSGRLTIDGVEHAIAAGTSIYMPARAEVSYVNGVERFHAFQVFAGPGPGAKYDSWTPKPLSPLEKASTASESEDR